MGEEEENVNQLERMIMDRFSNILPYMKLRSETQKGEEIVCKCTFRESIKKQMAKTLIYIFCYFLRLWVIHVHDCLSYGIRRKKTP
jgi:hypothetical protein